MKINNNNKLMIIQKRMFYVYKYIYTPKSKESLL